MKPLTAPGQKTPLMNVVMPLSLRAAIKAYKRRFEMENDSEVVRLAVKRLLEEAGIPVPTTESEDQIAS